MISKFIFLAIAMTFFEKGLAYLQHDGWIKIEFQHALDTSDQFTYRGNMTIPSMNSGLHNFDQEVLSQSEMEKLRDLAKSNDFYRLKAIVEYPNGKQLQFLTSSKACSLLQTQLMDLLWISIDASGAVLSFTQTTSRSVDCYYDDKADFEEYDFKTEVFIRHTELSPGPDTTSFIQKIEREREARDRGEIRDSRGFFAKYWMYIVPVVILVFISGATNQETQK